MFTFTGLFVDGAREMARHGQKDEARIRLRFIRNSSIIQILKQYQESPFTFDLSHLEWKLRELENDCLPNVQPDCSGDFAAIRSSLETIAGGVAQLLSQNVSQRNL
jgi:hypothetical protein